MLWSLLLIALVAYANGFRVVCYYTNWSQYRSGKGRFLPENINPNLCTHISYAFVNIQGKELNKFEENDEVMYGRVMNLKKKNAKLKVLLAVGGYNLGSTPFIPLVQTDTIRREFAANIVKYLRMRNFDGFELDWEYPAARGSGPGDKLNFVLFVQELKKAFTDDAKRTEKVQLELGVAVAAGKVTIDNGYDVPRLASAADFINVMTYDFHGGWENTVGFNSPLYAFPLEHGDARTLNVDWAMKYWVSKGAPKSKLNLGVASYGRSFVLANPNNNSPLSRSTRPGNPAPFTGVEGIIAYYEVCDVIKAGGRIIRSESQQNPYVLSGSQWIGYDDAQSVTQKVCYSKKNGYGGAIFWTLDYDDFNGTSCGQGPYPLLTAINNTKDTCNLAPVNRVPEQTEVTTPAIFESPITEEQIPYHPPLDFVADDFRVNCYFSNMAQYRVKKGTFTPDNIDPTLCSHITYTYAMIDQLNIIPSQWNDETMFESIVNLKKRNADLKIILAVGGIDVKSKPFLYIVQSDANIKMFAQNAIVYLRKWKLDGLSIAWYYPAAFESTSKDKPKFESLMQTLKASFIHEAGSTGNHQLLLSLATPIEKNYIDGGYDFVLLGKYVDYFDVMTFEFHGAWHPHVGFNAPLYPLPQEKGQDRQLNLDYVAKYYSFLGASKNKLNFAIAAYGKSFTLKDPNKHDILSATISIGSPGEFTYRSGSRSYYEVCDFINEGATVVRVDSQGNPYAYKDNLWIGYDDVLSISKKIDYLKRNGYTGILFWTMDLDDFLGWSCDEGKYPLLHAVLDTRLRSTNSAKTVYFVEGKVCISIMLVWLVVV